jgi:hypothetical protein
MRRTRPLTAVLMAWAALWLMAGLAQAQMLVQRPFPQNALRGEITFGTPPEVLLNDRPARLAPGSRIRGLNNMLVMSATLVGQRAVVNYTLEPTTGLVHDVWLLRSDEVDPRKPWPTTVEEQRSWAFDPAAQAWTPRR